MLVMTSIIRAGKSKLVSNQIDEDSYSRIITCIRVLSSVPHEKAMIQSFLSDGKAAFGKLILAREVRLFVLFLNVICVCRRRRPRMVARN